MTQRSDSQDAPHSRALEVSFDNMAHLLGGAKARDVLAATDEAKPFVRMLDDPAAWLTPGTAATPPSVGTVRQLALEVLSLKLRAFAAVVAQLSRDQSAVAPKDVTVRLLDTTGMLGAARWSLHVSVARGEGAGGLSLRTSLGHLLGRLLFSNDQRSPDAALTYATELARTFASGSGSSPTENAHRLLADGPGSDSTAVLFAQEMRAQLAGKGVSRGLWSQVGSLLLRLLTDVADFSLPDPPLDPLAPLLTSLRQRCDIATFGAIARRDEISALLRQNLARLQDDGA